MEELRMCDKCRKIVKMDEVKKITLPSTLPLFGITDKVNYWCVSCVEYNNKLR